MAATKGYQISSRNQNATKQSKWQPTQINVLRADDKMTHTHTHIQKKQSEY